jgi:hypothetical protein
LQRIVFPAWKSGTSTRSSKQWLKKINGPLMIRLISAVDLKTFACTDTPRSSFIQRVCYDKVQSYMLINLRGTFYHYCELPAATYESLMGAPSMGQFYNRNIKGTGKDGPFDCRTHRVPSY